MKATWALADGHSVTHEVAPGLSLMEAATAHCIAGIFGECGGSMSCATCHVVVDPDWFARTGPIGPFEDQMLYVVEADRQPTSRLSCQIRMTADLDGIRLAVPEV